MTLSALVQSSMLVLSNAMIVQAMRWIAPLLGWQLSTAIGVTALLIIVASLSFARSWGGVGLSSLAVTALLGVVLGVI